MQLLLLVPMGRKARNTVIAGVRQPFPVWERYRTTKTAGGYFIFDQSLPC
jgi:hypothetical protein